MNKKLGFYILIGIIVGIVGLKLFENWKKNKSDHLIGLKNIVHKRNLHLVEYQFDDVIFLYQTKRNGKKKLRCLIKIPVSVEASISLDKDSIEINNDSKKIILSRPIIKEPQYDMREKVREIIPIKDGFFIGFGGNKSRFTDDLLKSLEANQIKVKIAAIKAGILEDTEEDAKKFILDLLNYFQKEGENYTIEFKDNEKNKLVGNLLERTKNFPKYKDIFLIENNAVNFSLENISHISLLDSVNVGTSTGQEISPMLLTYLDSLENTFR